MTTHQQEHEPQDGEAEGYQRVDDPVEIARLLKRVVDERSLVSVAGSSGQLSNSLILEVNANEGHFVLDALPQAAHERLLKEGELGFVARLQGVELNFESTLLHAGRDGNARYYHIAMPAALNYLQRRAAHRAQVPITQSIPVSLEHDSLGELLHGELHDLSLGGLCIRTTEDPTGQVPQDTVVHCTVKLPTGDLVQAPLEIRSVRAQPSAKRFLLGGRFRGLDPRQEQRVSRAVAGLEREARKRDSKLR